jgi:hypothetical protein
LQITKLVINWSTDTQRMINLDAGRSLDSIRSIGEKLAPMDGARPFLSKQELRAQRLKGHDGADRNDTKEFGRMGYAHPSPILPHALMLALPVES